MVQYTFSYYYVLSCGNLLMNPLPPSAVITQCVVYIVLYLIQAPRVLDHSSPPRLGLSRGSDSIVILPDSPFCALPLFNIFSLFLFPVFPILSSSSHLLPSSPLYSPSNHFPTLLYYNFFPTPPFPSSSSSSLPSLLPLSFPPVVTHRLCIRCTA